MIYFLLLSLILIQISILALIVWLYLNVFKAKNLFEHQEQNTSIKNLSPAPQLDLIKQVIHLEKFTLGFKTPYNGYLYITAQACDLCFSDDSVLKVKNHLEGLFLEKGELIFVKDPVNLKSVRFIQY